MKTTVLTFFSLLRSLPDLKKQKTKNKKPVCIRNVDIIYGFKNENEILSFMATNYGT